MEDLKTWEGLFAMAEQYAAWTDNQTPDIPDDGKNFSFMIIILTIFR